MGGLEADAMKREQTRLCSRVVLCVLGLTGVGTAAPAMTDNPAARVIVLANRDDRDSLRIARHYAEVRGVPEQNVIALRMPLGEVITWREFIATIWHPLLDELVAARWIDATPMALTDAVGRRKYAPRSHRIAALVVCRGVPLKIAHEPDFSAEHLPLTRRAEFRTNAGAVDAELSLLALPNYPINALVANPLFNNERPSEFQRAQVVKVARLDGPGADDANALVDRAVAAERSGLLGRAYIDIANREQIGDTWLESTAAQLMALGFEPVIDRESGTMPATARADAPVLYFGWYASEINGPFALPGFRFPMGAIALHIHSFSASSLRSPAHGWTGGFVARGITATMGNVYEPYLLFTHRPDLLLRALARGETLADAAYYSLQALSWQAILVGDPLYRPFAVPLDEQLTKLAQLPAPLAGYAVLRKMRQLDADGRPSEATALAVAGQRTAPNPAVGVSLVRRQLEAADKAGAGGSLDFVAQLRNFETDQWALAREAAQLLETSGRVARACEVWESLLGVKAMPRELRIAWLPDAIRAARTANDVARAAAWQAEWAALTSPMGSRK
jgi:uncharacterized protein (TIGR03790 family)